MSEITNPTTESVAYEALRERARRHTQQVSQLTALVVNRLNDAAIAAYPHADKETFLKFAALAYDKHKEIVDKDVEKALAMLKPLEPETDETANPDPDLTAEPR